MARTGTTLQNRVSSLHAQDSSGLKYVAVSHHPPVSAYFYYSPANHLRISGELKPKVKFLGNSVMTVMEGQNRVYLTQRPEDGGASIP